jgi:hypothetical protein
MHYYRVEKAVYTHALSWFPPVYAETDIQEDLVGDHRNRVHRSTKIQGIM